MALNIDRLRKLCQEDKIKWSRHALKRLRERKISLKSFENGILYGEIIKQYPDDRPTPSCLILSWANKIPLHIVIGSDGEYIYAITAYHPTDEEWELDMKTRKEH